MTQSWRELLDEFGVYREEPCHVKGCRNPGTHQMYKCAASEVGKSDPILIPTFKWCDRHYEGLKNWQRKK